MKFYSFISQLPVVGLYFQLFFSLASSLNHLSRHYHLHLHRYRHPYNSFGRILQLQKDIVIFNSSSNRLRKRMSGNTSTSRNVMNDDDDDDAGRNDDHVGTVDPNQHEQHKSKVLPLYRLEEIIKQVLLSLKAYREQPQQDPQSTTIIRALMNRLNEFIRIQSKKNVVTEITILSPMENIDANHQFHVVPLAQLILRVMNEFISIESGTNKLEGRKALEQASQQLLLLSDSNDLTITTSSDATSDADDESLIATILVGIALAMNSNNNHDLNNDTSSRSAHRSIGSALVAVLSKHQQKQQQRQQLKKSTSESKKKVHAIFKALFYEVTYSSIKPVTTNDNNTSYTSTSTSTNTDNTNRQTCTNRIDSTDWHIISGLAKALNINCLNINADDDSQQMASEVAHVVSYMLKIDSVCNKNNDNDNNDDDYSIYSSSTRMDYNVLMDISKVDVAAALSLAAQFQPWKDINPATLVNVAIALDLWHAAERICDATTSAPGDFSNYDPTSSSNSNNGNNDDNAAVEALLEGSFQAKNYRQADNYATKYYKFGGKHRFLEARYLHASSTITKVIYKGALPIIDKQIDRVDKSVETIRNDDTVVTLPSSNGINPETAGNDIRNFALKQLEVTGNVDAAHRLASMQGMDYMYDEEAILTAQKARREKYLQWEDVLPGTPPELISTPETLLSAVLDFYNKSGDTDNSYGFDVEWNENDAGADLLQIASINNVLLIDIPALSKTEEGVEALEKTVGRMFASCKMVGFACRQDITKLRSSRTCYQLSTKDREKEKNNKHWFGICHDIVDLQEIVALSYHNLHRLGLSRICEKFLGKGLDKSEQCSYWNARPLSLNQRVYAALDAWTVKRVYDILQVPKA